MKKCFEKAQQEEAFRELLVIMGANGGKVPYGAVDKLVKTYHSNGFKAVTRDNLNYRLKKSKSSVGSDPLVGSSVTATVQSNDIISDLSNRSGAFRDISNCITTSTSTLTESNDVALNSNTSKVGGRKKGSKKNSAKENEERKKALVTTCATLFNEEKTKAKKAGTLVPNGVLQNIIDEESKKQAYLTLASLDTIRSRVKQGNLDAFNANQISLIHDVEPTICQFCIRLAKMGNPLTKTTIIELANDLLADTEYLDKIKDCKGLHN
jgi:hypothetical protein